MHKTISKLGYILEKSKLTDQEHSKIKNELTVKPFVLQEYGQEVSPYPVFKEDQLNYYVPKFYGIEHFGQALSHIQSENSAINFKFNGNLRPHQKIVVEHTLDVIRKTHGGILALPTGFGKTTIGLYIASMLKLKTLVIVHKTFLQDQWYDRIKQFTDAKIGIIRQNKKDVENKDIVIGMLQSISMIDYDQSVFKDFDLVIMDECFPYDTKINTLSGYLTIGEIYDLWLKKSDVPKVLSFNHDNESFEYQSVKYAWKKSTDVLVQITLFTGTVMKCTTNHRILTQDGYIEAIKLDITHHKIACYSKKFSGIAFESEQEVINEYKSGTKFHKYHEHVYEVDQYIDRFYFEHDLTKNLDNVQHDDYEQNDFIYFRNEHYVSITNIEIINEVCDVYDIEIEHNHNFTVTDNISAPIVHNCHHVGSKVYTEAFYKANGKYIIGLSATPNRNDGLTKVMKWFLGDIIAQVTKKGDKNIAIKMFNYTSNDPLFCEKKRWFQGKMKPNMPVMLTNIGKVEPRNIFITDIIDVLRKMNDRKTLVLSGRVDHLKKLKKLIDKRIALDVKNKILIENEVKTGFYIGEMKRYELKDSEDCDIIFATYSMAEEGLDIDGLNTLILATPKKNIIQSIGRIMRKPLEDGDTTPLIIDINDNLSIFGKWGKSRQDYYQSKKYTIQTYYGHNDKCLDVKTYYEKMKYMIDGDLRKSYIIKEYGEDIYDDYVGLNFEGFDNELINYEPNFNKIIPVEDVTNAETNTDNYIITLKK